MKIVHKNLKLGELKVLIETLDDVWYMSTIIDQGDHIRAKTERKVKLGDSTDRNQKVSKRTITLTIEVEKIEFHKYTNELRVSGKITQGPEDIGTGVYHTIEVTPQTELFIKKERWLSFQIDKLKEAEKQKPSNILICVMDRDEAVFAIMKKYGYDVLSELKGDVQKKYSDEKIKSNFYAQIIKQLEEYDGRFKLEKIILASPAFWKNYLLKELEKHPLKKKITLATCNTSLNAIDEVLKRPEVISVIREDRIVKEVNAVEELLVAIKKDEPAAYGSKEVANAAPSGAIKTLLVTDKFITTMREKGSFHEVEKIMRSVDDAKGAVHIISSDHEGGSKLDGLGGIGALLRYVI